MDTDLGPWTGPLAQALSPFQEQVRTFFATRLSDLKGYEDRPQQVAMAVAVARAIEQEEALVVEAGTGTGKSLAYLVPSLLWSERRGGPVVISTRTLNLQQQLLEHDLPRLQQVLDTPPRAVQARGWSNYVCLRRLQQLPGTVGSEPHLEEQAQQLSHELAQGASGIRQHLNVSEALWSRIHCESTACSRSQCPFYQDCYLFQERRQLEQADLVVTNHSLLLADLALRNQGAPGILPRSVCLVLDEAHHLEDVACDHLARQVNSQAFERLQQQLYRPKARLEESGLLPALRQAISNGSLGSEQRATLLGKLDRELLIPLPDLYAAGDEFFQGLSSWLGDNEGRQSLTSESFLNERGQALRELGARLANHLEQAAAACYSLGIALSEVPLATEGAALELQAASTRLKEWRENLEFCLFPDSPDWVYFAQENRYANHSEVALQAVPLDIGQRLADELLRPCRSLVLTSATLAVNQDLGFYEQRVGLSLMAERVQRLCLDSPFDYTRRTYLGVCADLPTPGSREFLDRVIDPLATLVTRLGGRTFLLTTSYAMLRSLSDRLRARLEYEDVEVLTQGDAPNSALLERFRSGGRFLLVGTDSFWEGVDVPGEALSCVVLARLPFRVPTDPVVQAHCRRLESAGHSPFQAYQLPQAILKFRQGFGRLIRTAEDRGIVLVLDPRLIQKAYGAEFVRSLPSCTRRSGGLRRLVEDSLLWLGEASEKSAAN